MTARQALLSITWRFVTKISHSHLLRWLNFEFFEKFQFKKSDNDEHNFRTTPVWVFPWLHKALCFSRFCSFTWCEALNCKSKFFTKHEAEQFAVQCLLCWKCNCYSYVWNETSKLLMAGMIVEIKSSPFRKLKILFLTSSVYFYNSWQSLAELTHQRIFVEFIKIQNVVYIKASSNCIKKSLNKVLAGKIKWKAMIIKSQTS